MDSSVEIVTILPKPLESVFQGEIDGAWRSGRLSVAGLGKEGKAARIEADFEAPVGATLLLSIHLDRTENANLMGHTVSCEPSSEAGVFAMLIEFDNPSQIDRERLVRFLADMEERARADGAGESSDDLAEKRKFVRVDKSVEIEYQLYVNNVWAQGKGEMETLDIGGGGVKLRTNQDLEKNSFIYLNIPMGKETFYSMGKIVWVRPGTEKKYEIGIKFVDLPQGEQDRVIRFVHREAVEQV